MTRACGPLAAALLAGVVGCTVPGFLLPTDELLRTCDQVVLNVRADNPPALNAYRRLGYAEHLRFEERPG